MVLRILAVSMLLATTAYPAEEDTPVETVPYVDLERYAGLWYEIARFPTRFQRDCAGATAEYGLRDDGDVSVLNTCYRKDGSTRTIEGKAEVVDRDSNARLEVTFDNFFFKLFSWLVKADYWVIDLAPDYSYAVVGTPNRDSLWILARESTMDTSTYESIIDRVATQAFDTDRIERSADVNALRAESSR